MAEPLTYGGLLAAAERDVFAAMLAPRPSPAPADWLARQVAGARLVLATAGRHLNFLVDRFPPSPARDLADAIGQAVDPLAAAFPPDTADRAWRQGRDLLAGAHDLLAAHIDSMGNVRGPDGRLLADPDNARVAAARVADLVMTITVWSRPLAGGVAPVRLVDPPEAHPRDVLAWLARLAGPALAARADAGGVRGSPLDEVGPLLGDRAADPLEQAVQRARLVLFRMARARPGPGSEHLAACAQLGALIAGRLGERAGDASPGGLGEEARAAALAWSELAARLRPLVSLASSGAAGRAALAGVAIELRLARAERADGRPEPANVPTAEVRAARLLPDLAETGAQVFTALTRSGGGVYAIDGAPVPAKETAMIAHLYERAGQASRAALAAAAGLTPARRRALAAAFPTPTATASLPPRPAITRPTLPAHPPTAPHRPGPRR